VIEKIQEHLGDQAGFYLDYESKTVKKEMLHLPG